MKKKFIDPSIAQYRRDKTFMARIDYLPTKNEDVIRVHIKKDGSVTIRGTTEELPDEELTEKIIWSPEELKPALKCMKEIQKKG